jgi:hypothetical protein
MAQGRANLRLKVQKDLEAKSGSSVENPRLAGGSTSRA